ncbi:unnamed protein product [Rotaria sp. Silwood1]|nr:unnamed protein product [Rotaria sp. Silwood1]
MFWYNSLIRLKLPHLAIIITFISVFACIKCTTTQTTKNSTRSKEKQALSAEIRDYKSIDTSVEITPINEGFIIISDNQNKKNPPTISSTSARPKSLKRVSTSRNLLDVSSTTCKTELQRTSTSTSIITTTTLQKTPNETVTLITDHSQRRLGRRLLNDPSYDTEIDLPSTETLLDDDSDVQTFLKFDDTNLNKQLIGVEAMIDGSGETTEDTTTGTSNYTASTTTTSEATISERTSSLSLEQTTGTQSKDTHIQKSYETTQYLGTAALNESSTITVAFTSQNTTTYAQESGATTSLTPDTVSLATGTNINTFRETSAAITTSILTESTETRTTTTIEGATPVTSTVTMIDMLSTDTTTSTRTSSETIEVGSTIASPEPLLVTTSMTTITELQGTDFTTSTAEQTGTITTFTTTMTGSLGTESTTEPVELTGITIPTTTIKVPLGTGSTLTEGGLTETITSTTTITSSIGTVSNTTIVEPTETTTSINTVTELLSGSTTTITEHTGSITSTATITELVGSASTTITAQPTVTATSTSIFTESLGIGFTTTATEQTAIMTPTTSIAESVSTASTTTTVSPTEITTSTGVFTGSLETGSTTTTTEQTGTTTSTSIFTESVGTGPTTTTTQPTGTTTSTTIYTASLGTAFTTITAQSTVTVTSTSILTESVGTGSTTTITEQTAIITPTTTIPESVGTASTTTTVQSTETSTSTSIFTESLATGSTTASVEITGTTTSTTVHTESISALTPTTISDTITSGTTTTTSSFESLGTATTETSKQPTQNATSGYTQTELAASPTDTTTSEATRTTTFITTLTEPSQTDTVTSSQTASAAETFTSTTLVSLVSSSSTNISEHTETLISSATVPVSVADNTTGTLQSTPSTTSVTTTIASISTGFTGTINLLISSTVSTTITTSSFGTGSATITQERAESTVSTTITPEFTGSTLSTITSTTTIATGTTTITPELTASTESTTSSTSTLGTGTTTITPEFTGSTVSTTTSTAIIGSTVSTTTSTVTVGTGITSTTLDFTGSTESTTSSTSTIGTGTTSITPEFTGSTVSPIISTTSIGTGITTTTFESTGSTVSATSSTSTIGTATTTITAEFASSTVSGTTSSSTTGTGTTTMTPEFTGSTESRTTTASTLEIAVTDKGYITLDKPLYAIEPSRNELPDIPYIAPFWTNLVYVNRTIIRPTIYTGLSNGTAEWTKVLDTVTAVKENAINEEAAVYRVVKIRWENLLTKMDGATAGKIASDFENIVFDAYLMNGPGRGFTPELSTGGDRTVKRNPCPCSFYQASSDFRFYKLNSENRLEKTYNISCFVPLSGFAQRTSDAISYQQTCCFDTNEGSLITSGPFAGSVLDASALESLRYYRNRPQRIKERDDCCIAKNGTVDWSNWCNLYYEIRPPSTCDGYEPPSQAWFGGDPHILTSSNSDYSCNVFGSFIYAETTNDANNTANNISNTGTSSTFLKSLVSNELFSIIARTSKTSSRLRIDQFFNQYITYFSSFSMYLGSNRDVIIDVDINQTNSYQFKVNYLLKNENIPTNPFKLSNDFVEYYYYPASLNDSSQFAFSIIKENQTITAINWNTFSSDNKTVPVQIQVPQLTISIWSGLAMQCYVITNNMACTLLLPKKYYGNVRGLAFGDSPNNPSQYCADYSLISNGTEQQSLTSSSVLEWFTMSASSLYQNYINNWACPMNKTSSTYKFCVQDTVLSQSPLLGQLTVRSSNDYQSANRFLSNKIHTHLTYLLVFLDSFYFFSGANPPMVTLQSPVSLNAPYTYLLTIRHNDTFQNQTNAAINVIIDRNSSINVQIRDGNTSVPNDCEKQGSFYSCPFAYTNENRNQIQLTVIAYDISNNLTTYQRIQLIVNECVNGQGIWNNPTILSSSVSVLFCICDDYSSGEYCEKPVGCNDMTACLLNFLPHVTCTTNKTEISIDSTQTPFQCINNITRIPCSNDSACCKQGYQFHSDVQQCLFQSVCNESICGVNNTCQNSELKPNGYICMCNDDQIFNGTTCIQKNICDDASSYPNGTLPCTGEFEEGIDSGNQCICQCRSGFTNSSNRCISTSTNITCSNMTNVCYNTATSSNAFCQYRTQTYNNSTNQCQNTFCLNYCQNGTCSTSEKGYTCSCPPGTHLDYALNCATCEKGAAGPNCSLLCDCEFGVCNINATSETDKCSCAPGYTGSKCDEYVNYCDPQNNTCNGDITNRICKLTPTNRDSYKDLKAYNCICKTGYSDVSGDGNCTDIDECAVASTKENICPEDTTSCFNSNGSYSCTCTQGYVKDNSSSTGACVDEDECTTNQSACSLYTNSYCVNLRPYFECRCLYGYAPDGDYTQIYAALRGNQTCKIYNQCAANRIDCGGGTCTNNANFNDSLPYCFCNNSLILIQLSAGKYDCICPSNTHYYNGGICTRRPNPELGLVGESTFLIRVDCNNRTAIIDEIIRRFNETFKSPYNITIRNNTANCDESGQQDLLFDIQTDDNITLQNDVFEILENITTNLNLALYTVGKCNNKTELVKNVTSCYLIDLCDLCGGDIKRGACLPETGLSKCHCFYNPDSSRPYTGDFCYPTEPTLTSSSSSRWIPILVGVLAGLAGLFCAITCCLLALAAWRRRRRHPHDEDGLRIRRIWHLPRAQVPATVTAENVQTYLSSTASSTNTASSVPDDSTLSSDRSTYRTTYDYDANGTVNSAFFKQLDQNMGAKLRATITRPDTSAVLSSLPTLTTTQSLSSSTSITSNSDDPIDELDAIIDDEDLTMTFHDPLDDLFQNNEMLEVINPNLKLPRPQIDSKPTDFDFQRIRATDKFRKGYNESISLTSLANQRNLLSISKCDTLIVELASESNINLTESSLPPILNG